LSGPDQVPPATGEIPTSAQQRLAEALRRAHWALLWERTWPHLVRLLTVIGLFLAASWAGMWIFLPSIPRTIALVLFGVLAVVVMAPPLLKFRLPSRADALRRLDINSGIAHRPATALSDRLVSSQDPVAQALWQAHLTRTLATVRKIRVGLPSPRLALHDTRAIRALVAILVVATFFAAGGERVSRIVAAFNWQGVLPVSNVRLDAWVTPPAYTARPPTILAGSQGNADIRDALTVPAGSILVIRASGGKLDVAVTGAIADAPPSEGVSAPTGAEERRFVISGNGTAQVRSPSGQPIWHFVAVPDRAPTIALAKDPERQARGTLLLSYKIEDDYGVTEAKALLARPDADKARPLYEVPDFPLVLPNARTRNGVGQTVRDLTEHPFAGADLSMTLMAKDEAGNEGKSATTDLKLPERLFTKPLARALIEQRRILALDANQQEEVLTALDALLIGPEDFTPEAGVYLSLRGIARQLQRATKDEALRETVENLWALAQTIEDGTISDATKALQAAQDALRQALERGATEEEIKKLMDQLRAALDKFMQQLAEQLRNNPQQLARPLDPNARVMRPQDLQNMLDRMERAARNGNRDAARQMLDQLAQMLENLQNARPGQGQNEMEQALNELGDIIRKEQQLRDRTFQQGQDQRRNRNRGERGNQDAMNGLKQDQQGLRDRLQKLLDELGKQGMGPGQGDPQDGDPSEGLGDAGNEMGQAGDQLGQGNSDGAAESEGRAIESLRRGAQNLAQALQRQQGEGQQPGDGPGERLGRQESSGADADPLGRPLRGRDVDDFRTQVPGDIAAERARRVLEELRRRFGEPSRPQIELDYIERLLKDF
jgi:uncharacterized protein (TIGR02302 family)